MSYISFDVATKSLAVAIIYYMPDQEMSDKLTNRSDLYTKRTLKAPPHKKLTEYVSMIEDVDAIYKTRLQISLLDVVDLIPNKKVKQTTTIERTYQLYKYLETLRVPITKAMQEHEDTRFLIEYQMGPNDKSRCISSQIMLFCMSFLHVNSLSSSPTRIEDRIHLVGPALKNKIQFGNDEKSIHSYYLSKYKTNYTANKSHTKYILGKILNAYGMEHMVASIKKKNIDDIADAVCMALAFAKSLP